MKRIIRAAALLAAGLCLLLLTASADTLQQKTFAYQGARWPSPNTDVAAFWEAPALTGGETRTGGSLTLENAADQAVTLTLTELDLPYDKAEQMTYLDQLRLQIRDGDKALYDGAYSHLVSGDKPVLQVSLEPGASKTYAITLSCPFTYTGTLKEGPVVAWTFDSHAPVVEEASPDADFSLFGLSGQTLAVIACITGAVVFGLLFIVLLIKFIRHKED